MDTERDRERQSETERGKEWIQRDIHPKKKERNNQGIDLLREKDNNLPFPGRIRNGVHVHVHPIHMWSHQRCYNPLLLSSCLFQTNLDTKQCQPVYTHQFNQRISSEQTQTYIFHTGYQYQYRDMIGDAELVPKRSTLHEKKDWEWNMQHTPLQVPRYTREA
jgi:hypothetical protein